MNPGNGGEKESWRRVEISVTRGRKKGEGSSAGACRKGGEGNRARNLSAGVLEHYLRRKERGWRLKKGGGGRVGSLFGIGEGA